MPMFQTQVKFTGKHGTMMQFLCKEKSSSRDVSFMVTDDTGRSNPIYIFETRLNCYMVAAMLGILNNRQSPIDKEGNDESASTIMGEMFEKNRNELTRIYEHMILSEATSENIDEKVKEAFSIVPDDRCGAEQERLENYVRGGIEILYERFSDCHTYEEVCNAIVDLVDELLPFEDEELVADDSL